MDIPTDAAPLDDAHLDDTRARAADLRNASLRYRMLVRIITEHDRSFAPPDAPPDRLDVLAAHIADAERRCADILRHLQPDEAARVEPMLPIDLRPH